MDAGDRWAFLEVLFFPNLFHFSSSSKPDFCLFVPYLKQLHCLILIKSLQNMSSIDTKPIFTFNDD